MTQAAVGLILQGFCNGYFGRDSYDDKAIEALGTDWIVVRDDRRHVLLATFDDQAERDRMVSEWTKT